MAHLGSVVHPVDLLQLLDALERIRSEGGLTLERVKDDALHQVAQRQVEGLGQSLEDLDHALFHAYTGLYAFDEKQRSLQLAFALYVPGIVENPHKAIMAAHYLHIVATAWLNGCCDQEIHQELPAILGDERLATIIKSYTLVPVVRDIWVHYESELAKRRGLPPPEAF